jgi:WD40 repeat protein
MDINKDINEYIKNDAILLIMDFLYSQDLIDSLIAMEKETKLSIFSYNKELSFLRKLIIEGNWEESENFLLPLKSNSNFQYNSAIKLLKLQKLYETIETRCDNLNQEEIIKQLKDVKDFLKEEEFKDLINLLNKNSIKDIQEFNNWTVNRGRLKTFEKIKELFIVVYNNVNEEKILKNNLLLYLLIKINGKGNIAKNKLIEKINSFINEKNEKNNKININNTKDNNDNKNIKINNINTNINKEKENKISNRIKSGRTKDNSKIISKKNNINEKNKKVEKDVISKINNENKLDSQINKFENTNISNIPQYTETSSLLKETKNIISNLPPKKDIIKEEQNILTENMIFQKIESTYDLYSYDPSSFSMDSLIVDSKAIRAISFSSNGKILSLGTNSKSLKLYDFSPINDKFLYRNNSSQNDFISLKLLFEKHNHHAGSIYCLDFSPNDKLIATGSNDKTIKIFVVPDFNENMNEVLELAILDQKGTIRSVLFPPTDNNFIFSGGSNDNNINMWDTESGKKINSLIGHKECINSLKFSVDENSNVKLLGSCGNDNIICFHDYRTNNPVKKIEIKNHGEINDISFTNDYVCSVHNDGYIVLYSTIKETVVREIKASEKEIRAVNISKDGKFLMIASFDKKISIFDINDDLKLVKYLEHDDRAVNCKWHPDKPIISSSSADNTVRIWTPKVY